MAQNQFKWSWEIKPETTWLGTGFRELLSYKDLLFRLVRKEFLTSYQQTLLGPFWVLLQPILTVITYVLVFNKGIRFVRLSSDIDALHFDQLITGSGFWLFPIFLILITF